MSDWHNLGTGGLLCLLLLREIFGFMTRMKGKETLDAAAAALTAVAAALAAKSNGTSGDRSVEYWQQQMAAIVEKVMADRIVPALKSNTDMLVRIHEDLSDIRFRGGKAPL